MVEEHTTPWEKRPKTITEGMWDELMVQNALLKKELLAICHATGIRRFDPDIYDIENGEDVEILNSYGFTDVYSEMRDELNLHGDNVSNMTKEKADLILNYMIEQQKLCPQNQFFVLKTKDVMKLFGTKNKNQAIDWMEKTAKMFPGQVLRQKAKSGKMGYWFMTLTDSEIKMLKAVSTSDTYQRINVRTQIE